MTTRILVDGAFAEVEAAGTALEALKAHGVQVASGCGGIGTCGSCWVRVEREGASRWQLACQTPLEDGMVVSAD